MDVNKKGNKVELLAPAGNYECFLGAIQAGADAVYLGGSKFGARAYADNFSDAEIIKAIEYAHVIGKRIYLTLNTLIKEEELKELVPYTAPFYEAGLDGVIVQDMGALMVLKEAFPELSLHASTQMTLTGSYGASYLKDLGVNRIVPARELSLKEIREIKENTGLEIEAFIHGAMCYCYSGQCLMSSMIGGRSGNRGRCAQPCRLPYKVRTESGKCSRECYPLSMKDMCTLSILPDLIEAGIDSFKIEGRMKKAEYAAGVTAIYRKYIDLYYQKGRIGYHVVPEDLSLLSSLYIRSKIQEGYYFKHNGQDMITLHSPAYNGCNDAVLKNIRERYLYISKDQRVIRPVRMEIILQKGKCAKLTIETISLDKNESVTVLGNKVQKALKMPITVENVQSSLGKLGDTFFAVRKEDIHIKMDDDCFYSLKELNDLRRQGIEELTARLLKKDRKLISPEKRMAEKQLPRTDIPDEKSISVLLSDKEQLNTLLKSELPFDTVYLESDFDKDGLFLAVDDIVRIQKMGKKVYLAMPYIIREKDKDVLKMLMSLLMKADGALIRNPESYAFLKKTGYHGRIRLDAGMYCMNHRSVQLYEGCAESFCIPYELNHKEQDALLQKMNGNILSEQVIFGRIPLMVTANCTQNTMEKCVKSQHKGENVLVDRYRKEFPVMLHCRYCYNVILNSLPLSLHDTIRIQKADILRIQFTTEKPCEIKEILAFFTDLLYEREAQPPYREYTRGHEKRGIE